MDNKFSMDKKLYELTLHGESLATIERQLTDDEYNFLRSLSDEFEDIGDGWQGRIEIELVK